MKSKKVLIGLILAAFAGTAAISVAQTKANYQNNDLIEIGPDNFAGRIRSVVVDQTSPQQADIYAGAVSGGLYKFDDAAAQWNFIPYYEDGRQVTLNISYMMRTPHDRMIYIATGEGLAVGEYATPGYIVPKGKGLFRFDPVEGTFTRMAGTQNMTYINKLSALYNRYTDHKLFLYVATNDGLSVITKEENGEYGLPQTVLAGEAVQDVEVIEGLNMAVFSAGGKVYKVSDVRANPTACTEITSSCAAFGTADLGNAAIRVEFEVAYDNETPYIYAAVTGEDGMLKGAYLTHNLSKWNILTTSTITPFSSFDASRAANGWFASSIAVDPQNPQRIILGGSNLWVGQGYVPDSYYQWTVCSTDETVGENNFMEYVFPSSSYVHSGIHQIVPYTQIDTLTGKQVTAYVMATNGGVFSTTNAFVYFTSMNKGLNTMQVNGLCVANDGSILMGAVNNGCPFIQSRNASDGGENDSSWYDGSSSAVNHSASILWFGDGGQVEASMFQQMSPLKRRGFFFSSTGADNYSTTPQGPIPVANFGRAYADYFDYTNTQTWTYGDAFLAQATNNTNDVAQMSLFETTDNQANDSITFLIDTLGEFYHNGVLTSFQDSAALGCYATDYVLKPGDRLIVPSKPHFNYPFEYAITQNTKVGDHMSLSVHNPIANRLFVSGKSSANRGYVNMTATPTDYSRVYATDAIDATKMRWYTVFYGNGSNEKYETVGEIQASHDGDAVYINVISVDKETNYLIRVHNLNQANYNDHKTLDGHIGYASSTDTRLTRVDTLMLGGDTHSIARNVTSLNLCTYNNRQVLLVTCGGEANGQPNLYIITDPDQPATRSISAKTVLGGIAIYSALVEQSTGKLFLGTDDGVYVADSYTSVSDNSLSEYGDFAGVPVTSIRQQTHNMGNVRYIGHSGINEERYLFARTKFPGAIYFGTYGRGVFMDKSFVTDTTNEVADTTDRQWVPIQTADNGLSSISVYPNPATDHATIEMLIAEHGNAAIRVYDVNGRLVINEQLGNLSEGAYTYRLNTTGLSRGMYLINVNIGSKSATSKLVVR